MRRSLFSLVFFVSFPLFASTPDLFPRPIAIEPAVLFWTRIYTEVGTNGGLVHDQENLEIVYSVLRFNEDISSKDRAKQIEQAKKQLREALVKLSSGRRESLTSFEKDVLDAWPTDITNDRLRRAADNIRFQLGQADRFRAGVARSGMWRDYMRTTFLGYDVPLELTALPHVESSFDPEAYSKVGAAGIWQFTRSTGRLFMRVDHVVDERMDPFRATHAAARLLKRNHEITQSWPLAITAYNHGAQGMLRAKQRVGTDQIDEIIEKYDGRSFGFASRNFYVAFLAALQVDSDPHRFFNDLEILPPITPVIFETPGFLKAHTLAETVGLDIHTLRKNNLALRDPIWSGNKLIPKGYTVYLYGDRISDKGTVLAKLDKADVLVDQNPDVSHTVGRGDTLWRISRLYKVTVGQLISANNLSHRNKLRLGQTIVLPTVSEPRVVVAAEQTITKHANPIRILASKNGDKSAYRVRRGDTIISLARRFGLTPGELKALNKLRGSRIVAGQSLIVKKDNTGVGSTATLSTAGSVSNSGKGEPTLAVNHPL